MLEGGGEGVGLGWALCYLIQRAIEECNNARIYQGKQAKEGGEWYKNT